MNVWRKQSVKWTLNGKRVAKNTQGALSVKEFSKRFYGTLNAYDGRRKQIPLTEDAS